MYSLNFAGFKPRFLLLFQLYLWSHGHCKSILLRTLEGKQIFLNAFKRTDIDKNLAGTESKRGAVTNVQGKNMPKQNITKKVIQGHRKPRQHQTPFQRS